LKHLNLVKIGQKYGTLYIKLKYNLLLAATLNLYKFGLIDRSGISIYN